MFLNVFRMWKANNRAHYRCESVSQWHRHAAAASGVFISISNNGLFICALLSHDPLCDTVHCCPLKTVQKHGKVKWHAVYLELCCKWEAKFGSGLLQAKQLGNEI